MDNIPSHISWFSNQAKLSFHTVKSYKYTPHILVPSIGICVFVVFSKPLFAQMVLKIAIEIPQTVLHTALCFLLPPLKASAQTKSISYFNGGINNDQIYALSNWSSAYYYLSHQWLRTKRAWNEIQVGDILGDKDMVYLPNGYIWPLSRMIAPPVRKTHKYACVVFGSCTAPLFMSSLKRLYELQYKYHSKCNLIIVYTREAYAEDEWKLSGNICIPQHKTLDERIAAAKKLIGLWSNEVEGVKEAIEGEAKVDIVVDEMDDVYERKFNAYPQRVFILDKEAKVVFKGGIGPDEYNVEVIGEFFGKMD